LRLSLAMLAGGVLGLNRTERGMSAGLRTTLLVTLAATVSMIQVNLLLATVGKTTDSFSVLDLMRLPLGILTGMGFIGAGAILRKGDRVSGVTTAATLWLATSLGLCFGGGQHGLGLTALALGVLILWALKRLESNLPQERRATLMLNIASGGPADQEIRAMVDQGHGRITKWDATYFCKGRRKISCEVHWQSKSKEPPVPDFVRQLVDTSGVRSVRWRRM
jgi:putative Mg2+ transporter-C (MgtC) family protein